MWWKKVVENRNATVFERMLEYRSDNKIARRADRGENAQTSLNGKANAFALSDAARANVMRSLALLYIYVYMCMYCTIHMYILAQVTECAVRNNLLKWLRERTRDRGCAPLLPLVLCDGGESKLLVQIAAARGTFSRIYSRAPFARREYQD